MVFGSPFSQHGFVVKEGESLEGFGWNISYQLGMGDCKTEAFLRQNKFISSKKLIKASCSWENTIFLCENGVYGVGSNEFGQLCSKPTHSFQKIPKFINISFKNKKVEVLDVFSGYYHSVILSKNLDIYSFGRNNKGQLGVGIREKDHFREVKKVLLPEKIIEVICGGFHTIFISIKGTIFVCGKSEYGETGFKNEKNVYTPKKLLFFKGKVVKKITCGGDHTLFMTKNNEVFGTGFNKDGQIGVGKKNNQFTPCKVDIKNAIFDMKCGGGQSFFRTKNKILVSGNNYAGQLGTGDLKHVFSPILFSIKGKEIIHSLLLYGTSIHFTNKDEVYGCGVNSDGQLFCGKKKEMNPSALKLCDMKVKRFPVNIRNTKEMRERFEFLAGKDEKIVIIF